MEPSARGPVTPHISKHPQHPEITSTKDNVGGSPISVWVEATTALPMTTSTRAGITMACGLRPVSAGGIRAREVRTKGRLCTAAEVTTLLAAGQHRDKDRA